MDPRDKTPALISASIAKSAKWPKSTNWQNLAGDAVQYTDLNAPHAPAGLASHPLRGVMSSPRPARAPSASATVQAPHRAAMLQCNHRSTRQHRSDSDTLALLAELFVFSSPLGNAVAAPLPPSPRPATPPPVEQARPAAVPVPLCLLVPLVPYLPRRACQGVRAPDAHRDDGDVQKGDEASKVGALSLSQCARPLYPSGGLT